MKKIGNIVFWAVVMVLVIYASYILYNRYKPPQVVQQPEKQSQAVGNADKNADKTPAPEVALKDLDGNTVKLSDYRGKIVFLNFWASWCPPCRGEMPDLNKADKELQKDNKAVLLAVNLTDGARETVDKAKKFIADNQYSMRVLLDTEGKVSNDYGIRSIPTTFVIDRDGKIYDHVIGPISEERIGQYVNELK